MIGIEAYVENIRRAAAGRWPQILVSAGMVDAALRNKHGPCPGCGGKDRFRFDDLAGRGTFVCSQGGKTLSGDGFALIQHVEGCDFLAAVDRAANVLGMSRRGVEDRVAEITRNKTLAIPYKQKHEILSDYGRDLLNECVPLSGAALSYLQARQCLIPPADGAVSYHARLKHFSGYIGPALVALITDAITGEPISLHRTWIEANGEKAKVKPPRLLLKDHRKQGGVVRLWPDDAVITGLAITEGIETALSLAHAFTPVWACIDASNIAAFPVLPGIEALTIGADNDEAGRRAADACAKRWLAAGREVRIILPSVEKTDFNDLARGA